MRIHSGIGLAALVVLSGGCLQILGYQDTTVVDPGLGGGGSSAHCSDGKKDGDEVGVDCGGSCSKCEPGKGCTNGADCTSLVCGPGGTCLAPACDDKVQNGDESDIDCGGGTCGKCAAGGKCTGEADCASGACANGVCSATCSDGMKNGAETAVDCGGGCAGCKDGEACAVGLDCGSGVCQEKACVSSYIWAKSFGDAQAQSASAIATDALGDIFLTGSIAGSTDFGTGPITTTIGTGFIARLAPAGNVLWDYAFANGGAASDWSTTSALTLNGIDTLIVAGNFHGTLDFGATGVLFSQSAVGDIFLVELGQMIGNASWKQRFSGTGFGQGVSSIATDKSANTLVVGYFDGKLSTDKVTLTAAGKRDLFLVKLDTTGSSVWSKQFSVGSLNATGVLATDSSDNILLAGGFAGTANFGGGDFVATSSGFPPKFDIFIAKLDSSGNHLWSKSFGDMSDQYASDVTVDSSDNVLVAGSFASTIDLGGGPLSSADAMDIFVTKLDPSGKHIWSKRFGGTGAQKAGRIAVDSSGAILVTGTFDGTVDFGGGPLNSMGTGDVFIVKLDSSGNPLWAKRFGDVQQQDSAGIAFGGSSTAVAAGTFKSQIDFGGGPMNSAGGSDIFLAKLLTP
jgi:hypothetical protein